MSYNAIAAAAQDGELPICLPYESGGFMQDIKDGTQENVRQSPRLGSMMSPPREGAFTVAEFFAGMGLVRMGLESAGFTVAWANDYEADKQDLYLTQFPNAHDEFVLGDIAKVQADTLPDGLTLAWASFPCTDLSLAGNREGLAGSESSTFWHFIRIMHEMGDRRPPIVALENVVGLATSRGGDDLTAAIRALNDLGYSADVLTLDARRFVPQSRPRLFIVGTTSPPADAPIPNSELRPDWLQGPFGDPTLRTHRAHLPAPPPPLTEGFTQTADRVPAGDSRWWDERRVTAFLESLSTIQRERLDALMERQTTSYRTAYRRTRQGKPVWEIRADDIAGCLRTARGGSSKQAVVRAGRKKVHVRWMTPREYAKLMGAGNYDIAGARTNQALFGFGDAVCVPAVRWLGEHYLMPMAAGTMTSHHERRLNIV